MVNPISLLLTGPFLKIGNSEMKVHTVGKDQPMLKIITSDLPVIPYQMTYKSNASKHGNNTGESEVGKCCLFRHCVVSVMKFLGSLS